MVAAPGPASLLACFASQLALLVAYNKAGLSGRRDAAPEPPVDPLPAVLDCPEVVCAEAVECDGVASWLVWLLVIGAFLAGIGASWILSAVACSATPGPVDGADSDSGAQDEAKSSKRDVQGPASPVPLCW